jgi:hypothetical protein
LTLCTQADVEFKLQWDITSEPDSTVTDLIADAQALIEAEVGRTLESASRAETFDGGPVALFLKYFPVTAVTSVSEDGDVLTSADYAFKENGRLIRTGTTGYQTYWRTYKPQSIDVDYTGGYVSPDHDQQLEHLGSLCAEVVARAFRKGAANASVPADAAGAIQSVTLAGSDTVTYATGGGGTATVDGGLSQFVYLLEDERRQLTRYKGLPLGFA